MKSMIVVGIAASQRWSLMHLAAVVRFQVEPREENHVDAGLKHVVAHKEWWVALLAKEEEDAMEEEDHKLGNLQLG